MMKFISLFAGIGGFDLGLERAGMECAAQVEIDDRAREVLARHWSGVPQYTDVKEFGHGQFRRGAVDLICGGFPCQDLSIAGRRAGLAGERSGLWFEFARIIDELEPRWVVIENVPGLLSSNEGRDFAVILQWLVKRGYGVAWRVLDAQYFGLAQRRRRVFIVASLGSGRAAQVLFESEGLPGDTPPSREAGKEVAYSLRSNPSHSGDKGDGGINTTMIPIGIDSEYNATMDGIGALRSHQSGGSELFVMAHGQANAEIISDGEPSLTVNHEAPIVFQQNTRDEVRLMGGDGRYAGALAAESGMKQQNYVAFSSKDSGNDAGELSPTLRSMEFDKSHINGEGQVAVSSLSGVRRLTPVECARLQGFPDDWNSWMADSTRYRQFGNAVAVPVAEWIGCRIMEAQS